VIEDLKDCNIEWVEEGSNVPEASISFVKKGKNYQVLFNVLSGSGKTIVSGGEMIFKDAEKTGKELALRLFAKGGGLEFEAVKEEAPEQLP